MKQLVAAVACIRCGSTEFAIDELTELDNGRTVIVLNVLCRNCNLLQGKITPHSKGFWAQNDLKTIFVEGGILHYGFGSAPISKG